MNLMWDEKEKKCYIVDFERAIFDQPEDDAWLEFYEWWWK
jgi:hypothetical protein